MKTSGQDGASRSARRSAADDLPLLDRALAGDTQAFEELVRRNEQRVYRTTLAITASPEDAEEAMQDTFLKAFRSLATFERVSRFSTWLTRIAVNEALQRLRRRRPSVSLDDPGVAADTVLPQRLEPWHANPEKRYAAAELRAHVENAIQGLPPGYRVAFILRDVEELSTEEAAEALGLAIPAFKSRLLRARLMLREALAPRFEQPAFTARLRRAGRKLGRAFARFKPAAPREM
jgi:RNA polymerase sigma-70 factor (ECF subfamily)